MNVARRNPNAAVAAATAVAGAAITWAAHKAGWTVESYYAELAAGALITGVLWVGRNGVLGLVRLVWRGKGAT